MYAGGMKEYISAQIMTQLGLAMTGFIQARLSQIQGLFKDQPHSFQGLWYLHKSVNSALLSIGSKSSNKFWVKTLIISAK